MFSLLFNNASFAQIYLQYIYEEKTFWKNRLLLIQKIGACPGKGRGI